jgi:hypothetical protein
MTCFKPSTGNENEAKCGFYSKLDRRATKNGSRKWHQAFTSKRTFMQVCFQFFLVVVFLFKLFQGICFLSKGTIAC